MSLERFTAVRFPVMVLMLVVFASVEARQPARPRRSKTITMSATAYCQSGLTASGERTSSGIVAADPRVLPLGTVVRVRRARQAWGGVYRVRDTGAEIKGRELDIYIPSCRDARQFGRQRVSVEVLTD